MPVLEATNLGEDVMVFSTEVVLLKIPETEAVVLGSPETDVEAEAEILLVPPTGPALFAPILVRVVVFA